MKPKFRHPIVTARYWVNGLVIVLLLGLPAFHIIKFDFLRGKFWLFGQETTWLVTMTGFLAFWAGSYVVTLLADYIYGRLFCGWICSWGSLLRALSYAEDKTKRRKYPRYAPQVLTAAAAVLSTFGLLNWFTDVTAFFDGSYVNYVSFGTYISSLGGVFVLLGLSFVMLRMVGLKFCQNYCPIGWYLGVISQKHVMRIDFTPASCTLGEVCVKECPMALDPRLLAMDTEKDSHALCILCGDCLSSCNACAAKVPGAKPLQLRTGTMPDAKIDLAAILHQMELEKRSKKNIKKTIPVIPTKPKTHDVIV